MSKNEEILEFVSANMALEGMPVNPAEKQIVSDCLNGKRSFNQAIHNILSKYQAQKV